jgi:hypothetical protein
MRLALVLLALTACAPSGSAAPRKTSTMPESSQWTVVMIMDGREVRRYENETTVCFKTFAGHGGDSISCHDKPQ